MGKHITIFAGGFQPAYVREVANALSEVGITVRLIASDFHAKLRLNANVRLLVVRRESTEGVATWRKLARAILYFIRALRSAINSPAKIVLYIAVGREFVFGLCFNLILKCFKKKVLYTVHNLVPHDRCSYLTRICLRLIYNPISEVLVVHTKQVAMGLMNDFAVPKEKIFVAPHGTYNVTINKNLTKSSAREALHIPRNEYVLLVFGMQKRYKGTHILLKHLAVLRPGNLKLLIRGTISAEYRQCLEAIILQHDLDKIVDMKLQYISDTEMELLFKATDAVVLPYLHEGSQSGVLFLSYAFGKPIVASNLSCFRECVFPGETGELFDIKKPGEMIEAIEKVKARGALYTESRIRKIAYSLFPWRSYAEAIYNAIARL